MSEVNFPQFRDLLLEKNRVPRRLNPTAAEKKQQFLLSLDSGGIKTREITLCPCGAHSLEKLTETDRFGLPFGSLICRDCGLVLTSPSLARESLAEYYEKYYHALNYGHLHMHEQQALFKLGQGKKIFQLLQKFLNGRKTLDVLEIGAGTGNVLYELKQEAALHNINVTETATEYSSDCLSECEDKGINAVYGDADTMLAAGKTFDIVILSHVFEHLTEPLAETEKLKKLLKPDGLLYIEVPGLMNIHAINTYNFDFLEYLTHAHIHNFNSVSLQNIMALGGFRPLFISEAVEAVFILSGKDERADCSGNYTAIMEYLEKLVYCREFLKDGIDSFRRGLNNAKEELGNVHRWHEHEKREAEKYARWHKSEKENFLKTSKWLDTEKKVISELMHTLDEYFKTPYTSISVKINKFKSIRAVFEKYRKRYLR
ncbi:MAG: class I SAM-dependent methyltransferase [Deferribacterales bacterium]